MGKVAAWVLMLVMGGGGVAHASAGKKAEKKLDPWDAVRSLQPGEEIDVLAGDSAGPEACLVSTVDDSALTCLREDSARDTRLVFPRQAVREVRVWAVAPDRHIGLWIGAAIGFVFGGLICAEAGPGAIILCGMLGAAVVVGAALDEPAGRVGRYPGWPRPAIAPRPPRMRRRLVYRAATP